MMLTCKGCKGEEYVKNGFMQGKQRYRCKSCGCNFTEGDGRSAYDVKTKQLVVRMYLNNCGFRRISAILEIPLTTVFEWIKAAGQMVDEMVKERKDDVDHIEILEMDELYTYIQKNRIQTSKAANASASIPEFGLLSIRTEAKMLRLR